MIFRILSPVAFLVASMAFQAPLAFSAEPSYAMKKLEHLLNAETIPGGIRFTVISTGCTSAEDFIAETNSSNEIAIYRIRPDLCRRAPMPVTLTLDWNPSADSRRHPKISNTIDSTATER